MMPELLAPAGCGEALVAAVQNGADAVYLGAGNFNARRSAGNFDGDGLREAARYCHARGVKVYVTLNTLVREDEIEAFADTARSVYESGADAAIVQDFGVSRILRSLTPELCLHASTQMAVHNRQGVEFLANDGFQRVVLARELTFDDMRDCAKAGCELEVFVHGALCVACSGQCLFSSMVGGRSGNRGMCAQPCRLEYEYLGKKGHLLSPKDLMGLYALDTLREIGISSLKIEGRLKRPEYVAVTTRIYRKALDEGISPSFEEELAQMFNRGGFTHGYASGIAESDLMFPQRANNLGVSVGKCVQSGKILLERDIQGKDALALRNSRGEIPTELSGNAGENISCNRAQKGDILYRTVSEAQMAAARESYAGEHRAIALEGTLTLRANAPASLTLTDGKRDVRVQGDVAQPAQKPADRERAAAQMRKTGGTPYQWKKLTVDMDENAFMPVSGLNALRREAFAKLEEMPPRAMGIMPDTRRESIPTGIPNIIAQASDADILIQALRCGADEIAFAPMDVRANALEHAMEIFGERKFFLVPPPVLPAKSLELLHTWSARHAENILGVYMTNIAQLDYAWQGELRGGFMLHCASEQTRMYLQERGIHRYTPSIEANVGQIRALSGERELVVYGKMPLMWLRHCPMRAALGLRGKHADCRRCDTAESVLEGSAMRDRRGMEFSLRRLATDAGCVIELQNRDTLMLLRKYAKLPSAKAWRILLDETDAIQSVVCAHIGAAHGQMSPDAEILQMAHTTTGHYFRGVE